MHVRLPPLRLTGALTLRDGAMQQRSVAIASGRITKGPLPAIDLSGYYVMPGIIDLQSSACENSINDTTISPVTRATSISIAEKDAARSGVTTAWLSQRWSWEGGARSPDHAEAFAGALRMAKPTLETDLRLQLQCEIHAVQSRDRLLEFVDREAIDSVLFYNQLQQEDPSKRPTSDYAAARLLAEACRKEVPRHLCRLADRFDTLGVVYGSAQDWEGDTRETYSLIGAKLCVQPKSRSAAALARAVNDPVLLTAQQVLHPAENGSPWAMDVIANGRGVALASGARFDDLIAAVFKIVDENVMPLEHAWRMVSKAPANIMRLSDRGEIDFGKRADLVIINQDTRAIEATIARGRITYIHGEARRRFADLLEVPSMAAE